MRPSGRVRAALALALLALSWSLTWSATEAKKPLGHVAVALVALLGFIVIIWPTARWLEQRGRKAALAAAAWLRRARTITAERVAPPSLGAAAVRDKRDVAVRGREQLVQSVVGQIEREHTGAWCCYGFMGVGKSTVLEEIARLAKERNPATTVREGVYPRGPTRPSFAEVLAGLLPPTGNVVPDDWQRLAGMADELHGRIVVLDEFPYDDADATAQLEWLLATLKRRSIRCFFVLAARERPHFAGDVDPFELGGIDLAAFTNYCTDIGRLFGHESLPHAQVTALHEKTAGNPQLARLAIANSPPDRPDFQVPEEAIEERVWSVTSSSERDALRTLAALHRLEAEVPEQELTAIVADWSEVRLRLVQRCLTVQAETGRFKIHDLINTYVARHDDAEVRRRHSLLAKFYTSSQYFDRELRIVRLAAGHCAESHHPETVNALYAQVATRLRSAGAAWALRGLTEAAMLLSGRLTATISAAVRADLGWSLAQIGDTGEALAVFTKLRYEMEQSQSDGDPTRQAAITRQIADCRRLRGDVLGAERDLRNAAARLKECGLGDSEEALACMLDHAHCGYLAARPDDSLVRLDAIDTACAQSPFAAEWWYRRSKAQRLLWDLDGALHSAGHCMQIARDNGSDLSAAKGRWGELAAGRLALDAGVPEARDDAIGLCTEVEQCFQELGYRAAIFVRHDRADLLRLGGEPDLAADEFRRIRVLTEAMGETNREAHSWLGEAECMRAADGSLGEVGGGGHLDLYEQALIRYKAMGNLWGMALSTTCQRLARGDDPITVAEEVLVKPCCRGERELLRQPGTSAFPLNFV